MGFDPLHTHTLAFKSNTHNIQFLHVALKIKFTITNKTHIGSPDPVFFAGVIQDGTGCVNEYTMPLTIDQLSSHQAQAMCQLPKQQQIGFS